MAKKYVGVQAGANVVKLRVGTEEVELTPAEAERVRTGLGLAMFKAKIKNV